MLFSLLMSHDDSKQIGDGDWPTVKKIIHRIGKNKQLG